MPRRQCVLRRDQCDMYEPSAADGADAKADTLFQGFEVILGKRPLVLRSLALLVSYMTPREAAAFANCSASIIVTTSMEKTSQDLRGHFCCEQFRYASRSKVTKR